MRRRARRRDDGQPVGTLTDRDVVLALAESPDVVDLPVSDVMTKGAISVAPTAPIDEVRAKFGEHAVRRLRVVDSAGQLHGVIGWADLAPTCPRGALAAS